MDFVFSDTLFFYSLPSKMMAPVIHLDTLLRSFTTLNTRSLQTVPFLTFVIFVIIYILLAPTIVTLVFILCGLVSTTDESQKTCPTCDGSGVVDVPKDKSTQTEVH